MLMLIFRPVQNIVNTAYASETFKTAICSAIMFFKVTVLT